MSPARTLTIVAGMQLIQIGVVHEKTVLDLVLEAAERQRQEIEQLKAVALRRERSRKGRRSKGRCSRSRSERTMPTLQARPAATA